MLLCLVTLSVVVLSERLWNIWEEGRGWKDRLLGPFTGVVSRLEGYGTVLPLLPHLFLLIDFRQLVARAHWLIFSST